MITAHSEPEAKLSLGNILGAGGFSISSMPMVPIIVERLATNCADYMRHHAPSPMYFNVEGIDSCRITEVLEGYEQNGVAAVFHAAEWDSSVVIALDRAFIYTTTEALYGGDGSEEETTTARQFSNIEMRVANMVFLNIARAFESAFSAVAKVHLKLDRIETRMDFATIGRRSSQTVAAKINLTAINRTGEMCVLIPQSVISSMRNVLTKPVAHESVTRDPAWSKQIQTEIQRANVEIHAVLGEAELTLAEIAALGPNQIIPLLNSPKTRIKVMGNGQPLFWCSIGQHDGQYMLRIEEVISMEDETLDDILTG